MQVRIDTFGSEDVLRGQPSRVHEVYARFVQEMPDHPAFVEGDRVWSYREFSQAVDAASFDLVRLGIRPGDRLFSHPADLEKALQRVVKTDKGLKIQSKKG